ncbi:MAG: polysaccharide deacetylase family protein [Clostridia bacterium]|nr:polysaccharide deacetylase family protein [Clostridia bacterium]
MKRSWKLNAVTNGILAMVILFIGTVCFSSVTLAVTSSEDNVYRTGKESVSLMFNVYWGTKEVYEILDILDKFSVKSTFFVGGCWADDNVTCVREILSRGHELGNHGYFHKTEQMSVSENTQEIEHTHNLIALTTGYRMKLFAPPSGAYTNETIKAATSLGYYVILWSKDTVDWRDKKASIIYERATKAVAGDLVLMHPMEGTVEALANILSDYKARGLSVTTVSENLGMGGIEWQSASVTTTVFAS